MKTSTKAALLSGLVFPGAGHFYLKRYLPGVLLALAASVAVYLVTSYAVQTALDIVEQIESGSVQPDIATITTLVTEKMHQTEEATNHLTIAFIALWLIGIFDSYRIGKAVEKALARPRSATVS